MNENNDSQFRINISIKDLLLGLFFYPSKIMPILLLDGRLLRPFLGFVIAYAISSIFLIAFLSPKYYLSIKENIVYMADYLGDIEVSKSEIEKEKNIIDFSTAKRPSSFVYNNLPLTIRLMKFNEKIDKINHPLNNILLINNGSDSKIYLNGTYWDLKKDFYDKIDFSALEKNSAFTIKKDIQRALNNNEKFIIKKKDWLEMATLVVEKSIGGFMILLQCVNFLRIIIMAIIFGLIAFVFRKSFKTNLILFFYSGMVAVLPTTIYTALPGVGIESYNTILSWSIIIYILIIFIRSRFSNINNDVEK